MNFLKCMQWNQNIFTYTQLRIPSSHDWFRSTTFFRNQDQNARQSKQISAKNPTLQGNNALQSHFTTRNTAVRSILWTQIRYYKKKEYPTFHQDYVFPSFDDYRKTKFINLRKTKWNQKNEKVGINYLVGVIGFAAGMYGTKSHLTHYMSFMAPAADVLALASIEVDISKINPGECSSLKWRGKPLFIKRRTPTEIESEYGTPMSDLKDPATPEERCPTPEWLIVIGICTHLGCVPMPNAGDHSGGFYCPCHGSHYDNLGRIRKGPAPTNLVIPPYKFISETLILVG